MKASASTSEGGLDFDRLFRIREAIERGALRVHTRDAVPDGYRLARGDWQPPSPLRYKRDEGGSKQHDMIGTTHGLVRLVSGRFVDALRDGGFSGWATFPVEVAGKDGEPLDYHGWVVTGRAGPRDDEDRFDPGSWDGSDVFMLGDTVVTVVTEAVRSALEAAGVTGVEFTPLSQTD